MMTITDELEDTRENLQQAAANLRFTFTRLADGNSATIRAWRQAGHEGEGPTCIFTASALSEMLDHLESSTLYVEEAVGTLEGVVIKGERC